MGHPLGRLLDLLTGLVFLLEFIFQGDASRGWGIFHDAVDKHVDCLPELIVSYRIMKRRLSNTNLSLENNLPDILTK